MPLAETVPSMLLARNEHTISIALTRAQEALTELRFPADLCLLHADVFQVSRLQLRARWKLFSEQLNVF